QETRGWSETEKKTKSQRFKETVADYRYFPEPDIPPLHFSQSHIARLKRQIPELPDSKVKRFKEKYNLKHQYIKVLTSNKNLAEYAEAAMKRGIKENLAANDIAGVIVNRRPNLKTTTPFQLVESLKRKQLDKISDEKKLNPLVEQAIVGLPKAVEDYRRGKKAAIAALIGKVMQLSEGRADASLTKRLLEKKLKQPKKF
ncbi:unnamed protein product, partial [marine sediment metagenome]